MACAAKNWRKRERERDGERERHIFGKNVKVQK